MYINVNNINLYYEVYGDGTPLILVHGNGEDHTIFNNLIKYLKSNYKVYVIDSRCHGKSDNTLDLSYNLMAQDITEFIKKLAIIKPIYYGFSDGGIIGLIIAINNPDLLSKLIISGVNINPDGLKKYFYYFCKLKYLLTKDKLIKLMLEEPNINLIELHNITLPTLITVGKYDLIKKNHTKLIHENIKQSKLITLPLETHSSYIRKKKLYNIINDWNNN